MFVATKQFTVSAQNVRHCIVLQNLYHAIVFTGSGQTSDCLQQPQKLRHLQRSRSQLSVIRCREVFSFVFAYESRIYLLIVF